MATPACKPAPILDRQGSINGLQGRAGQGCMQIHRLPGLAWPVCVAMAHRTVAGLQVLVAPPRSPQRLTGPLAQLVKLPAVRNINHLALQPLQLAERGSEGHAKGKSPHAWSQQLARQHQIQALRWMPQGERSSGDSRSRRTPPAMLTCMPRGCRQRQQQQQQVQQVQQ